MNYKEIKITNRYKGKYFQSYKSYNGSDKILGHNHVGQSDYALLDNRFYILCIKTK